MDQFATLFLVSFPSLYSDSFRSEGLERSERLSQLRTALLIQTTTTVCQPTWFQARPTQSGLTNHQAWTLSCISHSGLTWLMSLSCSPHKFSSSRRWRMQHSMVLSRQRQLANLLNHTQDGSTLSEDSSALDNLFGWSSCSLLEDPTAERSALETTSTGTTQLPSPRLPLFMTSELELLPTSAGTW